MTCLHCDADISGKRKDAKWCSGKCAEAARRAAGRVAVAAYRRKWRAANHEAELNYGRKYRNAQPEVYREYQRRYFIANRDAILAQRRASRDAKAAAASDLELVP